MCCLRCCVVVVCLAPWRYARPMVAFELPYVSDTRYLSVLVNSEVYHNSKTRATTIESPCHFEAQSNIKLNTDIVKQRDVEFVYMCVHVCARVCVCMYVSVYVRMSVCVCGLCFLICVVVFMRCVSKY